VRAAAVPLSRLVAEGRWDAAYHLSLAESLAWIAWLYPEG
jgi:hypothetical protein